jgi:hypothetical protein
LRGPVVSMPVAPLGVSLEGWTSRQVGMIGLEFAQICDQSVFSSECSTSCRALLNRKADVVESMGVNRCAGDCCAHDLIDFDVLSVGSALSLVL